jgi:hypothetical protein
LTSPSNFFAKEKKKKIKPRQKEQKKKSKKKLKITKPHHKQQGRSTTS